MIRSIRKALLHIPKRNNILAVIAGYRVHDGSGNNERQKGDYEENVQSHDGSMLRHFSTQRKRKIGQVGGQACAGKRTPGLYEPRRERNREGDPSLDVVVQEELVGMGTEPERVHFLGPLVVDMHLDGVLGEHVALQEEIVVRLEVIERLIQ